eukprot:Gb_24906 [translate_table: standard]
MDDFKRAMTSEFEMTDLGLMHYFLGMEVRQLNDGIFVSQGKYAVDLLDKFKMTNCKSVSTPLSLGEKLIKDDDSSKVDPTIYRRLVGSLMYLTSTRPDIMYAVSLVSRFMQDPSETHFRVAKRILRYVNGTCNFGIWYTSSDVFGLVGYTDSDWAGSIDDRKSTSGYAFNLGSGVISWSSKKQSTVSLSTAEAEYIATTLATCQTVWLRRVLVDLKQEQSMATTIYCDNNSTIAMTKNPVFHGRTKHIDIRHHFIRDPVEDGQVELRFCRSSDQLADVFTKALSKENFERLRQMLGVTALSIKGEIEGGY